METLAEQVRCSFCGHEQAIDAARLAALRRYREEASADFAEARSHRREHDAWRAIERRTRRTSMWALVFLAPMIVG
jgi:hypothetical protein